MKIKAFFQSKITAIGLPMLALCWVSFFWGTTWVVSKMGVKDIPGLQLAAIRQFIGGAIYILFFTIKGVPWPKGKQWNTILILSFLNFVMSNGLSTWGVKYISSGLASIIGAIFPIWIVVIYFFRGEKIARLSVVGLLVCFTGVCIIFYEHLADFLNPDFRFGILLSLTATVTWAFGTLYTRKKASSYNPYFSLGIQMFISSLALSAYLELSHTSIPLSAIPMTCWYAIAYLIIIGSVLTFTIFIYSIQNLPPEISSIYAYINPIVAVLLGVYVFDESLTFSIILGGIVTLVGLYLVNYSSRNIKSKTSWLK
jgi:drug/metabolite transporter (DMT)-like permease